MFVPKNPFAITNYYGKEYFCDRTEETSCLISNFENGNSTTLISLRRMGKTGLIHHTIQNLPENWKGVYVDVLETENLTQFLNKLSTNILKAIPQKSSFGKKIWEYIKTLHPLITFDSLSGEPQVSFNVKGNEVQPNIASIFQFIENQDCNTLIAIDEFQQILLYPEKNVDAWLRSTMQKLTKVRFIFSGSQQHIMAEMFTSPKKPFFRSTSILKIDKIDGNIYREFIIKQFNSYKKTISAKVVDEILAWTNGYTFYVQQLCNRTFNATKKEATSETWKAEAIKILKEQEYMFFTQRNILTPLQWTLLKAIAHDEVVSHPSSQQFIQKHGLGSSASVLRTLNSLISYELVYYDFTSTGEKFYSIYDVYFMRWVQEKY